MSFSHWMEWKLQRILLHRNNFSTEHFNAIKMTAWNENGVNAILHQRMLEMRQRIFGYFCALSNDASHRCQFKYLVKNTFKQVVALTLITLSDALYLNYDSFELLLNCLMLLNCIYFINFRCNSLLPWK